MQENIQDHSRRLLIKTGALALTLGGGSAACAHKQVIEGPPILPRGSFFKQVDDIEVYCEVSGQGPLMIMQAGAWPTSSISDPSRRSWSEPLAEKFTVLAFDARGCGKTSLGQGPISYGRIAADTARLMDVLGIADAHFIGHSDGGCIQLDMLLHFSERVKTATLLGAAYNHQAYSDSLQTLFNLWLKDMVERKTVFRDIEGEPYSEEAWSEMRQQYTLVSPHPEKFEDVMRQQRRCWSTEPNISINQLSSIERPVLVINSGRDPYIPTASMQKLAASIPNAERFDLPEMTHDIIPFMEDITLAASRFIERNV